MAKYKVGDKVKVRTDLVLHEVKYYMDDKSNYWYVYTAMTKFFGKVVTIEEYDVYIYGYSIEEDGGEDVWADEMFEGLAEEKPAEPTPAAPITVNLNINIDIYANACWHCRKGGIVDLYLNGRPGICPSCGRVCNAVTHKNKIESLYPKVMVGKPKENKSLTTEELKALPDGTRVFVAWYKYGTKEIVWEVSGWGKVVCSDNKVHWETSNGRKTQDLISNNVKYYQAYLEEPERPF